MKKVTVVLAFLFTSFTFAHAAEIQLVDQHKARAAIVLDSEAGPLARKAAELLESRVEQRTDAHLATMSGAEAANQLGPGTSRIVLATPDSRLLAALHLSQRTIPSAAELDEEGFFVATSGRDIILLAREGRGMIYAVGKLLHTAKYFGGSMFADPPQGIDKPVMRERVLYIPPHIRNFYEVKDAESIRPIIEELALWGINGLSVVLDESEFNDPFDNQADNTEGRQIWSKDKDLLKIGRGLGLKLGLVQCPNDAYKNQLTPEITGKSGQSWNQVKLVNPTIPAGRALIMRNKENLYRDLADSGLRLDNVLVFAYDTGGCLEEACRPWIITFLQLVEDFATSFQHYHPGARAYVTDWLANDDEGEMIADYLNQHPQTRIAGVWKQDRNAIQRYARLDKRFPVFTFVDCTMVGGWGTIGAQPFPAMITYYIGDGWRSGITGLMIYTEGIFDDFNKAMATQVAWNASKDAGEFAREYAGYFFGSSVADDFWGIVQRCERSWADPRSVGFDGNVFIENPIDAEKLEQLTLSAGARLRPDIRSSWRWQVFEYRARIGKIVANFGSEVEFRTRFMWALDAGVPSGRLKEHLQDKQDALDRYQVLVTELRERIYQEPATRFPSTNIEDSAMTQTIRVRATAWRQVLKELRAKLDAAH
jgi:hypothetical protein